MLLALRLLRIKSAGPLPIGLPKLGRAPRIPSRELYGAKTGILYGSVMVGKITPWVFQFSPYEIDHL